MKLKEKLSEKSWKNLKKLRGIVAVMGTFLGLTEGLYFSTWGAFLYNKFGGDAAHGQAILLTTLIQVVFCIMTIFLEVPTGALSDAIGRAHTVMLSWVFRFSFFVCLAILCVINSVPFSFCVAMIGMICFTIGYTLFNGAFIAWKADWMKENLPEVNLTWASSLFYGFRAASNIVGAVITILCYTHGFVYLAYAAAMFVSFGAMAFSMTKMEEVKRLHFVNPKKITMTDLFKRIGENLGKGMNAAFKIPIIFWILMTYGAYMFLLSIVLYLWPVYLSAHWGAEHFTWQWMALAIVPSFCSVFGARWLAQKSHDWLGQQQQAVNPLRNIFIGMSIAASMAIFVLSICTYFDITTLGILFAAVFMVVFSFSTIVPAFEALINYFIPEELAQQRATVMSGGSMVRGILMGIFVIPAGGTGGQTTPIFWSFPAALLLISAIVTAIVIAREQKKFVKQVKDS